jgi:hypothetical protein
MPPDAPMNPRRAWLVLLFPALVVAAWASTQLGLFGFLPPCKLNQLTGFYCPGCGGTRAFQALARADLPGAMRMNPLGVILISAVALLVLRTSWEAAFPDRRWPRWPITDRWAWWTVGGIALFFVLRNLPWSPFTLLAPH